MTEAGDAPASDVAVINTCTVTATADAEVRQTIRRIHRQNPHCRILVTGCYAQRAPEEISRLEGVSWVVGNSHKHRVAEIIQASGQQPRGRREATSSETAADVWVGEISAEFHFLAAEPDDRTRPVLKIQDGCNARCSFCIIPAVRGRSRSLPPEQVITRLRELAGEGFQEVVLSGINLGSYGRDLAPRATFLDLLKRILAETRIARLRISSIEPMDVSADLIRLVAGEPRFADHFHVPLQSGSDRILRQMNRRYWTAQYAERILAIREAMPCGGIGADVMVGFPGETAADHAASASFIDSLPFTYLHLFPYSARPSTPAAVRRDQVEGRVAQERGTEMRRMIARKRQDFLRSQLGRTLSAVTLGKSRHGETMALSSNYLNLSLADCTMVANRLIRVRAQRVHEDGLWGYVEHAQPPACAAESN